MARIRTFKPDFWTDEAVVECSFQARLLFLGSLSFCDDYGNFLYSPKKLKMQIFPADSIDVEPLIKELLAHGLISDYSVSDKNYIHINGFCKHQKINRRSNGLYPQPPWQTLTVDSSKKTPEKEKEKEKEREIKEREIKEIITEHPWLDEKAWMEFEEHRAAIKKPMTLMARKKTIDMLKNLSTEQQRQCINNSIANGWQGIFPDRVSGNVKAADAPRPALREL